MLNAANSCYLLLLSLSTFSILLLIRQHFIQQKKYIFLFHTALFILLFIPIVVAGGVLNDAYQRLEQFRELEETGKLETARAHPDSYDSILQIDFTAFKDSHEFRNYIKEHEQIANKIMAISLGWLFVFLSEIVSFVMQLIAAKKRNKQ